MERLKQLYCKLFGHNWNFRELEWPLVTGQSKCSCSRCGTIAVARQVGNMTVVG